VFSARRVIVWGVTPLAAVLAGPLADQIMEPAMQPGGALAGTFGGLVGAGPGAGMSLVFVLAGVVGALVIAAFALIPAVREIEIRLPDHDQQALPSGDLEVVPADR
jgi:DHA3 family macrolide efflux protein-like MFS transporter